MSDRETAIDVMMGFSIDKMYNTVMLIEAMIARNGVRSAEQFIEEYCKKHYLPTMNLKEFMGALSSAMQRKLMLIDPDEDVADKTIIH